tara:strand:+ start:743 stop:1720 length:978 start_codon:yes stop_codon:yes gene_type:complete
MGAWASIPDDVHEKCKDVKDYVGCITVFSGEVIKENEYEKKLREALRLLPGRMDNTSLSSFSLSIQPFTDAISLAKTDLRIKDSELVKNAEIILRGLEHIRKIWNISIETKVNSMSMKNCNQLNKLLQNINLNMGGIFVSYVKKEGGAFCSYYGRKENEMANTIKIMAINVANDKPLGLPSFYTVDEWKDEKITSTEKEIKDLLAQCNQNYKSLEPKSLGKPPKFSFKQQRRLRQGYGGSCSWAKFDISKEGVTENIRIIWEFPDDTFKNYNIRWIKKFKYDPIDRNGKVIKIEGHCVFMESAINLSSEDTRQYCEKFKDLSSKQ